MEEKRVVIDTNVIVSGILGSSFSSKSIQAWLRNEITVVVSNELKEEVNIVFQRPHVTKGLKDSSKKYLKIILGTLFNKAISVTPKSINKIIFSDAKDHFLFELAFAAKAVGIVTGDYDILKVKRIGEIEMLSPKQFCQIFRIK